MACTIPEVELFGELGKCFIISPTQAFLNSDTKVRASQLKFGEHFQRVAVRKPDLDALQADLKAFLETSSESVVGGRSEMLLCQANVAQSIEHLGQAGLLNEAEVRYAIVDPIVRMICNKWRLEVSIFDVAMYST